MANYLVTGGAGFIGSNLVDYLIEQGEAVRVVDNFLTGRRENLVGSLGRVELIEGDLRDPVVCARSVEDMHYVLHQAALPSVPRSMEAPAESADCNLMATVRLLEASARAGVRRLVYAGSSSVYGDQPGETKDESASPRPLSPYAAAKLAGEAYCLVFHRAFGLETVTLRYFNVFGPRQDPDSPYSAVIPRFITAMLAGRPPTIYGDGGQSRDFTFVENVVRANVAAATAEDAAGGVYNVGCGRSYTLLELAAEINAALGKRLAPIFEPPRPGDIRHSRAAIDAARRDLSYRVTVDFADGLRRTIDWFKERGVGGASD